MSFLSFLFRDDALEKLALSHPALFPLGAEQLAKETRMLRALLQNRLSQAECQDLLIRLKSALAQAGGVTEKTALHTLLQAAANGALRPEELDRVVAHLTGLNGIPYSSGDGLSVETAITIHTNNPQIGIELEQRWLQEHLGRKYHAWQTQDQSLYHRNGHYYDVFVLALSNGEERTVIFDISQFFQASERA